jgi:glycosyltransferase involved in cell wall biosynthesis
MKAALGSVISSGARGAWLRRQQAAFREERSDRRPRLLTDVSVIFRHDAQTGIQRVVRAVWSNLLERSASTFDVVPVVATRTHGYRFASPDFMERPSAERLLGDTVGVQSGDKFLGLDLSAHLLPTYKRQLSSWRLAGATTHLLVYDLLPLQRPHWFNKQTVRNFQRWIEVVRDQCDQALCISDHVARELKAYLSKGVGSPRIGRIQLAGDMEASLPSRGIDVSVSDAIDRLCQRPAILMVGTIEPRKGYDVALAAFEHLWRVLPEEAPALIIVGKPGWQTDGLQHLIRNHPEQGERLFWLLNVSDEGLARLYDACSAVFLASHGEGFGLPAMEAAMHGRYALVRDLPVFREQELGNLSFFTGDDPSALAADLIDLLRRANSQPAVAALPNWNDCVTDMLAQMGLRDDANFAVQRPENYAAA